MREQGEIGNYLLSNQNCQFTFWVKLEIESKTAKLAVSTTKSEKTPVSPVLHAKNQVQLPNLG